MTTITMYDFAQSQEGRDRFNFLAMTLLDLPDTLCFEPQDHIAEVVLHAATRRPPTNKFIPYADRDMAKVRNDFIAYIRKCEVQAGYRAKYPLLHLKPHGDHHLEDIAQAFVFADLLWEINHGARKQEDSDPDPHPDP